MAGGTHTLQLGGDWTGLYEYMSFDKILVDPPGSINAPTIDQYTGELLFSKSATNIIAGGGQIRAGWRLNTNITPSIFIRSTIATDPLSNPDIYWLLEYKWYNVLEVLPVSYTSVYLTTTLPVHIGGRPLNTRFDFPEIDGTGKIVASVFQWRLSRLGGNILDTYNDDCVLMHFNIRFRQYRLGSDEP